MNTCLNCEINIDKDKKFCSRRCSVTYNNKKRNKKKKKCLNCDSITSNIKFCCKECELIFKKNEIRSKIENGDTTLDFRAYKYFLIQKYGEKCSKCGWCEVNPTSGKIPIELEHKDGNSENNELENLELLCPNCHSLTPTYKALNTGNGRHKRRERYKEGKSF
jgi:predicted nucleic acid-binding Zn ribbon protein